MNESQVPAYKKDKMCRRFIFVLNNYKDADLDKLKELSKDEKTFSYFLAGLEVGESGTPHVQGYAKLIIRKRFSTLKRLFPAGTHFESARGSTEQNVNYIKNNPNKPDASILLEVGDCSLKDTETGSHAYEVKEWIEQGLTLKDLLADPGYTITQQHIKLYDRLSPLYSAVRKERPLVFWVYGEPGSGKTQWVHEQEGDNLYTFSLDKKWFDGYNAHEAILWDDFDLDIIGECTTGLNAREKLEQQRLLQRLFSLCDKYEFRGNVKGSSVQLLVKRVYIVAHQSPWSLWLPATLPWRSASHRHTVPPPEAIQSNPILSQIMRRITSIKHIELSNTSKLQYPTIEKIVMDNPSPPLVKEKVDTTIKIFKKEL